MVTWSVSQSIYVRAQAGLIRVRFGMKMAEAYLVAGVAKSRIGYKSVLHMIEMQPDGMGLIGEAKDCL